MLKAFSINYKTDAMPAPDFRSAKAVGLSICYKVDSPPPYAPGKASIKSADIKSGRFMQELFCDNLPFLSKINAAFVFHVLFERIVEDTIGIEEVFCVYVDNKPVFKLFFEENGFFFQTRKNKTELPFLYEKHTISISKDKTGYKVFCNGDEVSSVSEPENLSQGNAKSFLMTTGCGLKAVVYKLVFTCFMPPVELKTFVGTL